MNKIKITAGIIWACLGLIFIIALFPGLNGFSRSFGSLPFMKINPRFSGGEEAFRISANACTLVVHKPVFNSLIKERKNGFVQVNWRGKIPVIINDTIDFDRDSVPDFILTIDTKKPSSGFVPLNKGVTGLGISSPTSYGWAVRVNLSRTK